MATLTELTPAAFWQYSLALYSKPGVATACLALQNEYKVNVNWLLLLHWCYSHQVPLNTAILDACASSLLVTEPALNQHRIRRSAAKGQENYTRLKQQELQLEAQQQQHLVAAFNSVTAPGTFVVACVGDVSRLLRLAHSQAASEALQTLFNA